MQVKSARQFKSEEELQVRLDESNLDFAVACKILVKHGLQGEFFQERFNVIAETQGEKIQVANWDGASLPAAPQGE